MLVAGLVMGLLVGALVGALVKRNAVFSNVVGWCDYSSIVSRMYFLCI